MHAVVEQVHQEKRSTTYSTTRSHQRKATPTPDQIAAIEHEIVDVLARSPGFKAYYATKASDTQTFTFALWDDQAWADAARALIMPAQQRLTGVLIAAPPQRLAGEVSQFRVSDR